MFQRKNYNSRNSVVSNETTFMVRIIILISKGLVTGKL